MRATMTELMVRRAAEEARMVRVEFVEIGKRTGRFEMVDSSALCYLDDGSEVASYGSRFCVVLGGAS